MGVLVGVVEEAYLEAAVVRREAGGYVRVSRLVANHHHAASVLVGIEEVTPVPLDRLVLVPGERSSGQGGGGGG